MKKDRLLNAQLLYRTVMFLIVLFAGGASAGERCEIKRLEPLVSDTLLLEPRVRSSLTLIKGVNIFSLSCSLHQNGVLTFQRPGVESFSWHQDGIEKHPIPSGDIAFSLQQGEFTALIKISSKLNYTPRFTWYANDEYLIKTQRHNLIMGAFYGLGITLFLLSLAIGWRVKGHHLKRYSFYIFSLTSFFLLQEGQLFLFFEPDYHATLSKLYLLSIGLTVFSATWFISFFLNIQNDLPRINKFLLFAAITVLILSVLRTSIELELFWSVSGLFMGYGTLVIVAALFILAIMQAYRGTPESGLVAFALSLVFISMIFRIVPLNHNPFIQRYGFIIAFSLEAVVLAVALSRRISRIAIAKDKAEKDASVDQLCGIANRRGLANKLQYLRNQHHDDKTLYAAFYIDVDDFKRINDEHGHARGDVALRRVSDCLVNIMRAEDITCRVGGDEFIALAKFEHKDEILAKHYALKNAFASIPFEIDGIKQNLAASVGCAIFEELPTSLDHLIAASDSSMYIEKNRRKKPS